MRKGKESEKSAHGVMPERVRLARERKGWNQAELARRVGCTSQAVQLIEVGASKWSRFLPEIAIACEVSYFWLIGKSDDALLPPLVMSQHKALRSLPIISWEDSLSFPTVVASLRNSLNHELGVEVVTGPLASALGEQSFALVVEGQEMVPEIRPGDRCIIDPSLEAKPGDIVLAQCKRLRGPLLRRYRSVSEGSVLSPRIFDLVPANTNFASISCDRENPGVIIGVVFEHRRILVEPEV